MRFLRPTFTSTAFFTASVAAHLVVVALLFRSAAGDTEEAPAPAALTGETLSLPEDLVTDGVETPSPDIPESPVRPAPRATHGLPVSPPRPTGSATAAAASFETGTYGAVGERAASDISNAFTRAFPQAASADPVWLSVPMGSLGPARVELEVDANGNFVAVRIDEHAPAALRRGIERTVALIRSRIFTAHAPVTLLFLAAKVSPDDVHDGLHGDVFAIGGSFEGHQGNAFFALAAGRRIDLMVVSAGAGSRGR